MLQSNTAPLPSTFQPAHWLVPVRYADFSPVLCYEPLVAIPDDFLFDGAWEDLFEDITPRMCVDVDVDLICEA